MTSVFNSNQAPSIQQRINSTMVNFGHSLKESRRHHWKAAYLDYGKLKKILSQLDHSLQDHYDTGDVVRDENIGGIVKAYGGKTGDTSNRIKERFFHELGEEIEKISLFTLKMQGILSEAIGHLRFRDDDTINVVELFPDQDSIFQKYHSNTSTGLPKDDLEMYILLGVELLFLIQFVGVNTLAVRKVLKKYNKIIRRVNRPDYVYIMDGKDDYHLELIANSQSLSAIHSSLQSALNHFYFQSDLTATTRSKELRLFRFQSIIQASYVIRKNSEIVNQPFKDFLGRKAMINVGSSLGGIDGSEMHAMNLVLNFNPAIMLTCDADELDAMWIGWIPQYEHWKVGESMQKGTRLSLKEVSKYIMEVLADEEVDWRILRRKGSFAHDSKEYGFEEKLWGGVDMPSMVLNLASVLLYTINYYIIAPTANHYAFVLGADGAYGATLIGMSSFSAIIAALMYSFWYTKSSFKSALIFSSICPLFGNLIYALAISYDSMILAIGGRFLCGFGSAEVINRQLISTCVSFKQITRASAFFVASSAMGMSIGPLIAAILDNTAGRDVLVDFHLPFTPAGGIIFNSVTSPGFVMALLWFGELLLLVFFFNEPDRINATLEEDNMDMDRRSTEASFLVKVDYGSMDARGDSKTSTSSLNSDNDSDSLTFSPETVHHEKGFWGEIKSAASLIMANQGLPVTLLLFCYIELADEVLISSCSMVVRRYFGWNASAAGFLVAR